MAFLFSEAWIDEIERRHAHKPDAEQPEYLLVSRDPEQVARRASLEALCDTLDPDDREHTRSNLSQKDQFADTELELVTYSIFQNAGCSARYEQPIGGLTPDWTVTLPAGGQAIVDVLTKDARAELKTLIEAKASFQKNLQAMPYPVVLNVREEDGAGVPQDDESTAVLQEVEHWLISGSYKGRRILETAGLRFEALGPSPTSHVVAMWVTTYYVAENALRSAIQKKSRKYGHLQLPLLVAASGTFLSGLSFTEFSAVVETDLFVKHPWLSSAMWIWGSPPNEWQHRTLYNNKAIRPIARIF